MHVVEQCECANMVYEVPTINTASFGSIKPITKWKIDAVGFTEYIISKIDVLLDELAEHRDRLVVCLDELES